MSSQPMVNVSRYLLERLLECCNETSLSIELWRVLATPAEDVRAVVEKPVAYAVFTDEGRIRIWSSDCEAVGLKVEAEEGRPAVPLYRRPQRPVVLPERRDYDIGMRTSFGEGWSACLDAVEELNK